MVNTTAEVNTHNDPVRSSLRTTVLPQTFLHARENTRRQRHIEEAIPLLLPCLKLLQSTPKSVKRLFASLMPAYVGASFTKLLQLFRKSRTLKLDGRLDNGQETFMGHFIRGKSHDFEISGQEASSFLGSGQGRRSRFGSWMRTYKAKESRELRRNISHR